VESAGSGESDVSEFRKRTMSCCITKRRDILYDCSSLRIWPSPIAQKLRKNTHSECKVS
jgi:hypothetical protein